jgi:phenylpyruvate tautomerase PptA (4-oxalocrotonate tautomerase family)
MTIVTVNAPTGRLTLAQRRQLAGTLTDAVLVPEVGHFTPAARVGFQVHFVERTLDRMAIGAVLLDDLDPAPDVMVIDVAVMEAAWDRALRGTVIRRLLLALAEAVGQPEPAASWWVNFRVIDDGSWGSSGSATSILDLLGTGVFSSERAAAIREALE